MFSLQERRFPFIGDDLIALDRSVEKLVTEQIRDVGRYDPAHVYTFFIDVLGRLLEADYLGGRFANERITGAVKSSVFLRFPPRFDIPKEARMIDITRLFQELRVNSHMEWCNSKGIPYRCALPDPRFALMYDFARRREALLSSREAYLENREQICCLLPTKKRGFLVKR